MHRQPFYEVKSEAYLFPQLSHREGERTQNEEPVRQWCAFELIRAYGIAVQGIVLEHPVKVGSKKYGIDILVLKNDAPWAVVECKHRNFKDHTKGIEQAISYADAQLIQAEFAVYTNGTEWMVNRRVKGGWTPVVDLPNGEQMHDGSNIVDLLRTLDELLPVLHVLDEPLEGKRARKLLAALQIFFHGDNQITQGVDREIRSALDNLLRIVAPESRHVNYQMGKLYAIYSALKRYGVKTGVGFELDFDDPSPNPVFTRIRALRLGVSQLLEATTGVVGPNVLALRLGATLLNVSEEAFLPKKSSIRISTTVHHALREFLSYGLAVNLNSRLPDPIDQLSVNDLRSYCSSAWEAVPDDL